MSANPKKRTKSGCITCRIRRVKCDETKPDCKRCIEGKRKCDGYTPDGPAATLSRRELAVVVRSLPTIGPAARVLAGPQTPHNSVCWDFFRLRTAPTAGAFFPTGFWTTRLLQVAHTEPAVWSAVLALGALHRRWELGAGGPEYHDDRVAQFSKQAALCYGEALSKGKSITDPETLLVLSLALAAAANLKGEWAHSRVHIASGQNILRNMGKKCTMPRLNSTREAFLRLDLQAMTLSESCTPYPFSSQGAGGPLDWPEGIMGGPVIPPNHINSSSSLKATTGGIDSLAKGILHLLHLLRRALRVWGASVEMSLEQLATHEADMLADLVAWEGDMAAYMSTGQHAAMIAKSPDSRAALLSLKLYHACTRLLFKANPAAGPASLWDDCLAHFERLVAISAALIPLTPTSTPGPVATFMSLEPGLVIPLYFVVSQCRHPAVRRTAARLLRRTHRQEGVWTSNGAAAVGEAIIKAEEEGLGLPRVALPNKLLDEWADEVANESWRYWLGGEENWTPKLTWDGPRVPSNQRVVDTDPRVDFESGTVGVTMKFFDIELFDPATGAGMRTLHQVVDIGGVRNRAGSEDIDGFWEAQDGQQQQQLEAE
ncbi:hypothetical protein B0H63DRAFT_66588 [Podospora didyma]|uniref:Zn(2)-C6 fungal-type domain-containing protein n=1 Tax=Podospora didyma TaxID=330526 RepID=A0AAE0P8F9_9PEZI|nr:hypothetical protein B0H63DRAFT_66588 [Podospora didyma]